MRVFKLATTRMKYGAPGTIRTCDPLVRSQTQKADLRDAYDHATEILEVCDK